jgi:hypothetical protein
MSGKNARTRTGGPRTAGPRASRLDGQFGQAVVLTQFNWARGYGEGGEFKAKYQNGNFKAYANFSYNITKAIGPESNQYLLDQATYTFLLGNYHYTDDMRRMTGSAGAS